MSHKRQHIFMTMSIESSCVSQQREPNNREVNFRLQVDVEPATWRSHVLLPLTQLVGNRRVKDEKLRADGIFSERRTQNCQRASRVFRIQDFSKKSRVCGEGREPKYPLPNGLICVAAENCSDSPANGLNASNSEIGGFLPQNLPLDVYFPEVDQLNDFRARSHS